MPSRTTSAVIGFALVAMGVTVWAGEPAKPPHLNPTSSEAIVFEGVHFQGASVVFKVGDEVPNLSDIPEGKWVDRISSLKVGTDTVLVTWFAHDYTGMCKVFFGANAGGHSGRYDDLGNYHWDNVIDSLKVFSKDAKKIPCI